MQLEQVSTGQRNRLRINIDLKYNIPSGKTFLSSNKVRRETMAPLLQAFKLSDYSVEGKK